jgi:hypothetical protein
MALSDPMTMPTCSGLTSQRSYLSALLPKADMCGAQAMSALDPRADMVPQKKDRLGRRSLRKPIQWFDHAATAASFRFLRRTSKAITPTPLANSGSAAGMGTFEKPM